MGHLRLGRGGMGEVYKAEDLKINRLSPPRYSLNREGAKATKQPTAAAKCIVTLHGILLHDESAKNHRAEEAMERFLKRHEGRIAGIISGSDRVVFRGTLRSISYAQGMEIWLCSRKVLLWERLARPTAYWILLVDQ